MERKLCRCLKESEPDLIILDVLMPRLDGREVLRQLRHSGNWIPIILLTQVGEVQRAGNGSRRGC
jgi:DNA-binding response OmpR family regulator